MPGLSFYDKQHIQKILAQQSVIASIFNQFISSVSPYLRKWRDMGKSNVWLRNQNIENAVDKELQVLIAMLEANISAFQQDGWNRSEKKNDVFIREYIRGMSISSVAKEGLFTHNLSALAALQNSTDVGGLTLSDRVWNIGQQAKTQLEFYLNSGISVGRSASEISRDMRQILKEPGKRFRRLRNEKGELVLSQPMKDYHPGQGVYRSAYMNALRTSATTTNIAYRTADYERWSKQDFTLGIEIHRSANNHGPCRICDAMVGIYPKTFKFTGFHPFCICFAVPKLMKPEDFADYLLTDKVPEELVITSIPQRAQAFVSENKDRLQSAFWYRDNFDKEGGLLPIIQFAKSAPSVISDKRKFVFSAKTPQEAIEYIKANIADEVNLDIRKTDLSLINDIINQLHNRMDEFGISKFSYIGVPSKKAAIASWDEFDNSLKLNLSKLRNPSLIWKKEESWLKKGIKYSAIENESDVIRNIIDHELGHKLFLQYDMRTDAINTFSKAGKTINGINEVVNLGYYASTEVHEYFAEAFSMFMGPGRSNVGKETGAMLDRLMEKVSRKLEEANKSLPRERKKKHIKTDEEKADIQKRWVYRKVSNTENDIRMNKKFETGVVFDSKGNILVDKRGASYSISFEKDELLKMKDGIFTHNHPRGWGYPENSLGRIGNSFSVEDISLAVFHDLVEMRAVTPNYTFIMKRPDAGWGDYKKAMEIIKNENDKLKREFGKRISIDTLTPNQANATHYHILWKRVSKQLGWEYSKSKTR